MDEIPTDPTWTGEQVKNRLLSYQAMFISQSALGISCATCSVCNNPVICILTNKEPLVEGHISSPVGLDHYLTTHVCEFCYDGDEVNFPVRRNAIDWSALLQDNDITTLVEKTSEKLWSKEMEPRGYYPWD